MKLIKVPYFFCLGVLFIMQLSVAAQSNFTDDSDIKTFLHENFDGKDCGMVVGLVDEHGARIFRAGKLDNGTDQEVNGDTVFEIGSITKTFTVLLLLDEVKRGEMKLDDQVAKYLPASVNVPGYNGKQITVLNLASQDSSLPFNAGGLGGKDWLARYNAFTVEKMYSFLSAYQLTNEPGAKFQYSNLGMSLLGQVITLKAGTNFESLVLNRICRPLLMDDTRITLDSNLSTRAAVGHDESGKRAPDYQLQALAPAGAFHSTANDLLKYLSANLGLTQTSLTPLMEEMQVIRHRDSPEMGKTAMPWYDQTVYYPPGTEFLGHAGGTAGSSTFIGFDKKQRRGIVVLSNQDIIHSSTVGWRILQCAPLKGMDARTMQPIREYVGSGIAFEIDKQTHTLQITKVYPNTSAAQAGLSPGLIVEKIDDIPTAGKSLADCLNIAHGAAGTKIRLELVTPDGGKTNTVELTRQKIQL
jgi:D-alanyl-D-alanine-carboxypeptidase/D-alanyl-D-alanine-endopeptidase